MPITKIENKSTTDYILWKFPDKNISIGSQVIVHENEEALLFENGQLLTILKPGRHLVESGNIPGIESLISSSFKNGNPILVEVWFASKVASFDYKWGTRLQIRDNTYGLIIPIMSFGSYAIRIEDSASLIIQLVGKNEHLSKIELKQKLMPLLVRNLKQHIANLIVKGKADIFTISTELETISKKVQESIVDEFARFGIDLFDFYIEGLDVDEKDEEYKKIKSSLGDAASLKLRASAAKESEGFYQTERSFDALQAAAENEGGLPGTLLSGGLGLGLGLNSGQQMANTLNTNTKQQDSQQSKETISNDIEEKFRKLKKLYESGFINDKEYQQKKNELLNSL
tara:strand:- start:3957 stop:4982 length:1026 start_codon:yes stop_codon:yes gene_type:complete